MRFIETPPMVAHRQDRKPVKSRVVSPAERFACLKTETKKQNLKLLCGQGSSHTIGFHGLRRGETVDQEYLRTTEMNR